MAEPTTHPQKSPKPQRTPASSNRTTGQLSGVQVMFAVILAMGLLLAINFSSRISDGQPLLQAYDRVQAEIQQLQTEQANLFDELEYVQSDTYVERWARDRGKMIKPGERLVVSVPVGVSATATPVFSEITPQFEDGIQEPDPWQLWWILFFDVPPPQIIEP